MEGGFTGVVARMTGARPGPSIAFRFDIDAHDLHESRDAVHLPAREGFASVHAGAMHACGHDGHTTIGLGLAEVLARLRAEWPGTVTLVFQPGEEGVRGARAMVEAGVVDDASVMVCCHLGAQSRMTGHVVGGISGFLATTKLGAATAVLNLHAIPRHSAGE